MRVELSEIAVEDIVDILAYTLSYFGPHQADDYGDGLFKSFDILADNPRMGRRITGISSPGEVRRYVYQAHYVFYEIRGDLIHIATIRNTRQQLPPEWLD